MARREDLRINYGKGLRIHDQFRGLPHIDSEDPEFMVDVFSRAKEVCDEQGLEVNWRNIFRQAKTLAMTEFRDPFRDHEPPRHQFLCSLLEPGLEVMRYFPRIAEKLGMNVERELSPLWEYIDPDLAIRLVFRHWNYFSNMLDDLPEVKEKLRALEEKPTLRLFHHRGEHGLTASIRGDDIQIGIRENLDEHDATNARRFEGILGPTILQVTDRWIVEEFIDLPRAEQYDLFSTRAPEIFGNLLGCALKRIHNEGFSYNASLVNSVFIDPETDRLYVTNWCLARENGETEGDISRVKETLRDRYLKGVGKPNDGAAFLSSKGTIPFIKAIRGFYDGYRRNKQYPLFSAIK